MNKKIDKELREIEQAQKALRDSIEQSITLADKTEKLVQKHREKLEDQSG